MPQYQYQGFLTSGKNAKGFVTAENMATAKANLKKMEFFASSLSEVNVQKMAEVAQANFFKRIFKRASVEEISNMTRQLATLIAAHIPLVEALDALTDQVDNPDLKGAVSRVRADVNEGSTLHKALAQYPDFFSDLYVSMVQSGETSGALDVVLLRLADFLEYQSRLKKKVTGALIYPVLMMTFGLAAVLVIFTMVIPELESVFNDSKATLPTITVVILWMSRVTIAYWWAGLLLLGVIIFVIRKLLLTEYGKRWWDEKRLELPIFGELFRMIAVSRFTKTLSTLLRSGIPLLSSLQVVKNVVGNITIREAIEKATTNLTEGQGISGPLKRSGQFPPMVTHMVAVGERTGELESMLDKVAEHYEYQVNVKVGNFTSLIEPIMIIGLAVMVLVIVLSVILPMIELNNTVL